MSRLAFAIARNKFALEVQTGLALYSRAQMLLAGEIKSFWGDDEEPEAPVVAHVITKNGSVALNDAISGTEIPVGSVGVLEVNGPIMKDSWYMCGIVGSMEMAEQVKQLSSIAGISTILILHDSPGGQVDGTSTLADAIRNSPKRTISLVNDGMSCSADYWIASAADEMYVTHETCEVGSIGVYASLSDYSKYYEEKGIVVEDVYAEQSTEKNKGYRDWKMGDPKEFISRLSKVADAFIETVKTNRKGKLNLSVADPFKGAVYNAKEATAIGLIDGIKPYDEVMGELLNEKQKLTFI